ncbi:nicotinamide riboside transporter PnuC [Pseudomonas japonica]|uniref:Nicotinamide riboside transporter PnuC n=1 Tax=Pseudomonas japonica TaxID=256466 RepID=A0A239BPB2_9PSED|nr:nicotinamide riboside transporter PnuC [Pseudomonas japonica]SNS09198.1 nicotinamide mononucleotide transporter [Pseudomonas japonica]
MSGLEWLAVLLSALSVWLTVKQKIWCWPVGLVGVLLLGWVFRDAHLYSQMALQGVYAVLQVYGWWQWTRPDDTRAARKVSLLNPSQVSAGLLAGLLVSVALGAAMSTWTDGEQPWLDAAITGFSLVAQWWMAQKRVQCWPLWIVIDVVCVGLFLWQGLYFTAGLYALFTLLAIQGLREWRRDPALTGS